MTENRFIFTDANTGTTLVVFNYQIAAYRRVESGKVNWCEIFLENGRNFTVTSSFEEVNKMITDWQAANNKYLSTFDSYFENYDDKALKN